MRNGINRLNRQVERLRNAHTKYVGMYGRSYSDDATSGSGSEKETSSDSLLGATTDTGSSSSAPGTERIFSSGETVRLHGLSGRADLNGIE